MKTRGAEDGPNRGYWNLKINSLRIVYSPLLLPWIVIPEPPVSPEHVCPVKDLLEVVYVTDVEYE